MNEIKCTRGRKRNRSKLAFKKKGGGLEEEKGGRKCLTDPRKEGEKIQNETALSFRLDVTLVCTFCFVCFLYPTLCAAHVFLFAPSPSPSFPTLRD
jgi:hypothetical protein